MFDFLFGFDRRNPIEQYWIGTWNHFWLFVAFVLSCILLQFILPSKSKRGIVITKIGFIIFLLSFEIGRMVWRVLDRNHASYTIPEHDWVYIFSFTICAVHVWITIAVLIASLFVNSNNRTLQIFKNILFGSAAIGGVLSFIHPEHIRGNWHILHWRNLQTVVIHAGLVWIPLYFVKIGELKPRIKNSKFAIVGFVGVFTFITMVAHLSGHNFSWALGLSDVDMFVGVAFLPLLVYTIAFLIARIFYLPFEAKYRMENQEEYLEEQTYKMLEKQNMTKMERFYYYLPRFTFIFLISATFVMPNLLGANMIWLTERYRAIGEWYAVFIITPLIIQIFAMYFSAYKRDQIKASKV